MNLIRLREYPNHLKAVGLSEREIQQLKSCPVFVTDRVNSATPSELSMAIQHIGFQGKIRLPYQNICVAFKQMPDTPAIWFRTDGKLLHVHRLCIDEDEAFLSNLVAKEFEFQSERRFECEMKTTMWIRCLNNEVRAGDFDLAQEQMLASFRALLSITFDMINPANAVVSITPNKPGKSVQWRQAHTHYCIINKGQAQRCRMEKRGPTEHEIKRAAHWRRAHMRRLTSDKFKNKKGQLVFVRQSWVGPEEWIGTDKKIYKVINTKQP